MFIEFLKISFTIFLVISRSCIQFLLNIILFLKKDSYSFLSHVLKVLYFLKLFNALIFTVCGHCSVWSVQCVVRALCGQCSVWSMKCVVHAVCDPCSVWSVQCVVRAVCGHCSVWSMKCVVHAMCDPCSVWSLQCVVTAVWSLQMWVCCSASSCS